MFRTRYASSVKRPTLSHFSLFSSDPLHVGFSRGSYTAQWLVTHSRDYPSFSISSTSKFSSSYSPRASCSLAGMLQKVGLLPAFNDQQIPFVYEMYKSADMDGRSTEFKSKIGNDVKIEFIGLWCVCFFLFPFSSYNIINFFSILGIQSTRLG